MPETSVKTTPRTAGGQLGKSSQALVPLSAPCASALGMHLCCTMMPLGLLVVASILGVYEGAPCNMETFGNFNDNDKQDATRVQVVVVNGYTIDCCGLLSKWYISCESGGIVHAQIWRRSSVGYSLQWTHRISNCQQRHWETIAVAGSVIVQSGDVLGWYAETAVVHYDDNKPPDILQTLSVASAPVLGQSYSGGLAYRREYRVGVHVTSGNPPQLNGVPAPMTRFRTDFSVGQVIFTVSAVDLDPKDNMTFTATSSSVLGLNGADVVVKSALPLGSHTLTITVSDVCGLSASQTFTLNIINRLPEIKSLPSVVYVPEDNSASVLLHTLTSSDLDGDPVTCSYTGPHTDKFDIRLIPGNSSQGVYLKYPVTLDAAIKDVYLLSVSCNDSVGFVTADLTVYVTPNKKPVIANLPEVVTIQSTLAAGSMVFRVNATDKENDAVSFNFTCPTPPCPFSIYPTGDLLLDESLVYTSRGAYVLNVQACDHRRCSDVRPLTIYVTDLQTAPSLSLPGTVFVSENLGNGYILANMSVVDADGDTKFDFHLQSSPLTNKIIVDAQCRCIKLGANATLDYEKDPTSFVLTVTASDVYYSSLPKTLTVNVIDVNEAPVLSTSHYVISHGEDKAGTELPRPAYAVRDPDTGDTQTYWLLEDNTSPFFYVDPSTGRPSFAVDYDVDSPGRPSVLTFQVEIRDSGGLSTTATVTLSVTDVNDNAPDCGESLYVTSVAREATLGSQVFAHTITDADSGANARLSYSLQHPRGMEAVLGVRGQGQLYLHSSLSSLPHDSFNVTVTATDGGSPPLSCSYGLLVEINTVTRGFLELNMSWFVPFIMLLMLTGGLMAFYIARYCCKGSCEKGAGFRKKWTNSTRRIVNTDIKRVGTMPRPREDFMKKPPPVGRSGSRKAVTPTDVDLSGNGQVWDYWNSFEKF